MTTGAATSLTALARSLARQGRPAEAADIVRRLLDEAFSLRATDIRINFDAYSLNSLNGTFAAGGEALFFKFHQEENEDAMGGEYYRVGLLAEAGFPVDPPLHVSSEPGRQILVYRRRSDPRFADILRRLDAEEDAALAATALDAERRLNERLIESYKRSLHPITATESEAEPVHRLYHGRLVDAATPARLAGRFAAFYEGQRFELPGASLAWEELARLPFAVNGVAYRRTLGELFEAAFRRLEPRRFGGTGGVTAHGDAHNANVWFERKPQGADLVLFDPAFAGRHVPALLAEIKTTFHNFLAHPYWLYEPDEAEAAFRATVRVAGGTLHVEIDWRPGPVRLALLGLKRDVVWRPLLAELHARDLLPADWREVVRLALFCCPMLVMNLRAGAGPHNPTSSAIGLATAVAVGSEPQGSSDIASRFLDEIDPVRQRDGASAAPG